MTRRPSSASFARGVRLAAAGTLLLPIVATAQLSNQFGSGQSPTAGRGNITDRARPAAQAKLDEAVKKYEDEDLPTKLEGIQMLGTVEDKQKALGYLLAAASDPNPAIRLKAIDVLGTMGAKEAIPQLVQQLFMRDTDKATKQHVLVALGKIGDPKAVKPILDFLARPGDDGLDGNAIHALGEIGDKAAIPPLERIVKDGDPTLRPIAQAAVVRIKQKPEPEVVPPALAADLRRAGGEGGQPPTP